MRDWAYVVYEFFVHLRLSTGLLFSMSVVSTWVSHLVLDFSDKTIPCWYPMSWCWVYLGCVGLRWKIPFINRDTNQYSPSWRTPGLSTIALIALRCVPIALWLSPNSYNVCKKLNTWLTVGWWGLSCRLLQKSSHRRTGVFYYHCVLTPSMMLWWSGQHQVRVPLLRGAGQNCCYQTEPISDWVLMVCSW